MFERYLAQFRALLDSGRRRNIELVVIKMPIPRRFYDLIPGEAVSG